MPRGVPCVIMDSGGVPVTAVDSGAPLLSVATNGKGFGITLTDNGTPFIIEGLGEGLFALSTDDGSILEDDDGQMMETYE